MSAHAHHLSLKRKASADLLADLVHPIEYDATQSPTKTHVQQRASPKEISSLYEKTYLDTINEIKRLLQHYAFVLAADANPDLNPDGPLEGDASAVHACTSATVDAVADAKTELKAILDDLASKPELLSMEEVRKVLMDCGIVVDLQDGQNGERVVNVRMV